MLFHLKNNNSQNTGKNKKFINIYYERFLKLSVDLKGDDHGYKKTFKEKNQES